MLIAPQESFDDAPETPENLEATIPQSSSTRSLTDSPPIGVGAAPAAETTEEAAAPSDSQAEQKDEKTEGDEESEKKENPTKGKKENEDEQETNTEVDEPPVDEVKPETADEGKEGDKDEEKPDEKDENDEDDKKDDEEKDVKADNADKAEKAEKDEAAESDEEPEPVKAEEKATEEESGDETPVQKLSQKSPLLTSHRLSSSSSLDEVNLSNGKEDEPMDPRDIAPETKEEQPPVPPKDDVASPLASSLKGLSGSLPSIPWGPPPVNKNPPPAAPPPPARKPSGPFSWFSRSSTGPKEVKSPPQSGFARRNTATSVSTIASNLDLIARPRDGEEGDTSSVTSRRPRRNSLKDQFKMLRMREEAHAADYEEGAVQSSRASISQAGASPPIIPEEGEDGILAAPAAPASGATSPGAVTPSTINPNLPPGTVSGFSRSATDASTPVDWDLWQQVVDNGPQALASSEELNAAIKRGIPQTIRGVIWQILADCRTGEMEDTYRELVARGTDKDRRSPNVQINGIAEKESTSSSRSSIRSENSGSVTQSTSVAPSPSQEVDPERLAKEQVSSEGARLKKAKDESASLQKLEKAIRRDLGARTSYSKYFISQGSQESLFGLCKAYALYDEGVGYAQGMNFIVMPLLFNVSR